MLVYSYFLSAFLQCFEQPPSSCYPVSETSSFFRRIILFEVTPTVTSNSGQCTYQNTEHRKAMSHPWEWQYSFTIIPLYEMAMVIESFQPIIVKAILLLSFCPPRTIVQKGCRNFINNIDPCKTIFGLTLTSFTNMEINRDVFIWNENSSKCFRWIIPSMTCTVRRYIENIGQVRLV